MRFPKFTAALAALCLSFPTLAQHGGGDVQVFGGNSMRACSTVVLFGNNIMAGITVTHGQPEWKADYNDFDKMVAMVKGKLNRLGKDMWTTLMSNVDLEMGGVKVPAGSYVCGIMVGKDGAFQLALMDATKAMKESLMPFGPQKWQPEILVPMDLHKDHNEEPVEKMLMTLAADEKDPMHGTFTIAWGPHALTCKTAVHVKK